MNDVLDAPKARDFWKSSGFHLVSRDADGWLTVTPELLRAYYARPEIHPVDESCAAEVALFERLMENPALQVTAADLTAMPGCSARARSRSRPCSSTRWCI